MTLRTTQAEDAALPCLARQFRTSTNAAAGQALDLAVSERSHPEFVRRSTERLLRRYSSILSRLAEV